MSETVTLENGAEGSNAHPSRSLVKGLIAGAVAGLVATAAKSFAERLYPPRIHGEPEPPAVLADKIAGHQLAPTSRALASESIHWGFGTAVGAAYGAIVEFYPSASAKHGTSFGMTLLALTHETGLPAMGLGNAPEDQTARERTSEMATHVVYGVVTETVRKIVRSVI